MLSRLGWFWPALSLLLAALWLWTLLRRRATPAGQASARGLTHLRVEAEDLLKTAYVFRQEGRAWGGRELARWAGLPGALARDVAAVLVAFGWAEEDAPRGLHLTDAGAARAQELIRAHRLWERYLADREGLALDAVHAEADRREHETTEEELERLDADLGYPAWDPHGHPIPAPGGRVPAPPGRPLLEQGTQGSRLRIVSLDDKSAPLLAQLMALGLKPGTDVEVLKRESGLLRLRLDGDIIPVAAAAARSIFVLPVPALLVPLGELPAGARALVVEVRRGGKHQRRMLDMGFVPGADVTVLRKAPLGDPIEYRVKGTAIALRQTDANSVMVEELADD